MVVLLPRIAALGAAVLLLGCSSSEGERAAPSTAPPSMTPPASASPAAAGDVTYLALGDSVAVGSGARDPASEGYVPVLAGLLSDRSGCEDGSAAGCPVQVRNLAVAGATTATLLRDQLPPAFDALREGGVRLVTVTIGGNDVFEPVLQACAQSPQAPSCTAAVRAAIAGVDRNVDRLLADLTAAAAPGTTVAVMTYYDPLSACRLAPLQPLAGQVLEGRAGEDGLNDVLRARAVEHGAVVVETGDRLAAPRDFVGGLDCLHPSSDGHARIAEAFADALAS